MPVLLGEDAMNCIGRDGVVHAVLDAWQSMVDLVCQQGFHYWNNTLGPGALPERFMEMTDKKVSCLLCLAKAP